MKETLSKGRVWKLLLLVFLALLTSVSLFYSEAIFFNSPSDPSSRLGWYVKDSSSLLLDTDSTGLISDSLSGFTSFSWVYLSGSFTLTFEDGETLARLVGDDGLYLLKNHSLYFKGGNTND